MASGKTMGRDDDHAGAGGGLGAGGAALAVGPAASGLVAPADTAETANGNPAGLTRLQHPE
jgi:hypothetical protein